MHEGRFNQHVLKGRVKRVRGLAGLLALKCGFLREALWIGVNGKPKEPRLPFPQQLKAFKSQPR